MLIPVEVEERIEDLRSCAHYDPGSLSAYGPCAWCRCEWFNFMLWAEMEGAEEVQLSAVNLQEEIHQYKTVKLFSEDELPAGDLSVEANREVMQGIQEEMLAACLPALPQGAGCLWQLQDDGCGQGGDAEGGWRGGRASSDEGLRRMTHGLRPRKGN
jgi:hypothetical protein